MAHDQLQELLARAHAMGFRGLVDAAGERRAFGEMAERFLGDWFIETREERDRTVYVLREVYARPVGAWRDESYTLVR